MKTCTVCRAEKPANDFYKSARSSQCRSCYLERCRAWYWRTVETRRAASRKKNKTPAARERIRSAVARLRARVGPAYGSAHHQVNRAIERGLLVRPPACEKCGAKCRPHGHHDDYKAPLVVMWLCPPCHSARHRELGRGFKRRPLENIK